ncbi:MAG: anhydro-N-acetylmuramic acid kinase, partial [Gammaproteobacteria bacterium]|nr:anhydro-N-acetylmuramic acid kinase [Gammaproteobacteria bacterium]
MDNNLFIGVMSGTSLDAVDAVLVDLSDSKSPTIIHSYSLQIPANIQNKLFSLNQAQSNEIELMLKMDVFMGNLISDCCMKLLSEAGVSNKKIIAIGSHGQTIRHYPGKQLNTTLQIGDANIIAERTGITTIADFRRRDMAVGGQGAPLVPAFHNAIFRSEYHIRVIVNIGGISNITCLPKDINLPVFGFDTGPGNTLIDLYCQDKFNTGYDSKGKLAFQGSVNQNLLSQLKSDPYFWQTFPKTTGRDYFGHQWLVDNLKNNFNETTSKHDILATLTELTAQTIIDSIETSLPDTEEIFICGGGAKNDYLMNRLNELA